MLFNLFFPSTNIFCVIQIKKIKNTKHIQKNKEKLKTYNVSLSAVYPG